MKRLIKRKKESSIGIDKYLIITVFTLTAISLLMITSASMAISEKLYSHPFHYLFHQIVYLLIGVIIAFFIMRLEIQYLQKKSKILLLVSILLLIIIMIPGIGHQVHGSTRWISFGFVELQVSEIVKLAVIIYMADYFVRRHEEINTWTGGFIKPIIVLSVVALLLLIEPDFGVT